MLKRSYANLESKNADDLLSEAEFKELQVEISALYRMMELDAQSR